VDTFKSNSVALINAIEASSSAQPQLTNWLHELRGSLLPAKEEDSHSPMRNPGEETAAC